MNLLPRRSDRPRLAAFAVLLVLVASCSEARRKKDRKAAQPAPATAAATAPAAQPDAGGVTPDPTPGPGAEAQAPTGEGAAPREASERRGVDPARVDGRASLTLSLPGTMRLGGFSFSATYDPARFHVGEPQAAAAMQGYLCQSNMAQPGLIRFNCAGLVNEDRGGLVASFPVGHVGAAPVPGDFVVTQFEAVDDLARSLEGARAVLAVEALAAP